MTGGLIQRLRLLPVWLMKFVRSGLVKYENTDFYGRVWPRLFLASGDEVSVALLPGEQVELDLPEGFSDPYLRPVPAPKEASAPKVKTKSKEQSE